jgi:hypothetical protein
MARRGSRDIDNLAAKAFTSAEYSLSGSMMITSAIGSKYLIDNLSLCRKGLTAAGYAQNELVAVK